MPEPSDQTHPLLAMVALNTPSLPEAAALARGLRSIPGIAVDLGSMQAKEGTLVFGLGKDNAAVALMSRPIPWSNLEGPCATAWWWPDATQRMKNHNSHILAALVGDTGNLIQRHVTLTHLTAVVASQTDAAGIFLGSGTLVHDPLVFIQQAQDLSNDNLPLHLWIDFRVEPNDDGSFRLFTTGMKAFGKAEIEIPHSSKQPAEVVDFAYAIADYILTRNPDIQDGHTFGRSPTEKVRAAHMQSMWDSTTTVLRLDF